MFVNYSILPYLLAGVLMVAMLGTFGAIASRKYNFNYGMLSPVSFAIYTIVGYLLAKHSPIDVTMCCTLLIGMFEATAGWRLVVKLKANTGGADEQAMEVTNEQRVVLNAVIGSVFGMIGFMLAHNITF